MYASRLGGPLRALGAIPLGVGVCWLMSAALSGDIISTADVGSHDILFGFLGETLGRIVTGREIRRLRVRRGVTMRSALGRGR
ncbi:hypothetical protein [Streptomyces sp. C36]|uniref:hypothetical protein n=1 Tax=Streptomyces sp. C36 TaxID=3237122 RepID=UPI0034C5E379